jgi:hypothetical protein
MVDFATGASQNEFIFTGKLSLHKKPLLLIKLQKLTIFFIKTLLTVI